MKKTFLFIAVIMLFGLKPMDKGLTRQERDFAVQFMELTRDSLLLDLQGLSTKQLNWKADSTRWSVAQCVEHIALAEGVLMTAVDMNLKLPADPAKRDSLKYSDQQIMAFLANRNQKFQAPEMIRPSGKFSSFQAALDSFITRRNRNIEYLKTTQDDLRDHFFMHPGFGIIDDYQAILFMTAHSKRHTKQLEEVVNSTGYPKSILAP